MASPIPAGQYALADPDNHILWRRAEELGGVADPQNYRIMFVDQAKRDAARAELDRVRNELLRSPYKIGVRSPEMRAAWREIADTVERRPIILRNSGNITMVFRDRSSFDQAVELAKKAVAPSSAQLETLRRIPEDLLRRVLADKRPEFLKTEQELWGTVEVRDAEGQAWRMRYPSMTRVVGEERDAKGDLYELLETRAITRAEDPELFAQWVNGLKRSEVSKILEGSYEFLPATEKTRERLEKMLAHPLAAKTLGNPDRILENWRDLTIADVNRLRDQMQPASQHQVARIQASAEHYDKLSKLARELLSETQVRNAAPQNITVGLARRYLIAAQGTLELIRQNQSSEADRQGRTLLDDPRSIAPIPEGFNVTDDVDPRLENVQRNQAFQRNETVYSFEKEWKAVDYGGPYLATEDGQKEVPALNRALDKALEILTNPPYNFEREQVKVSIVPSDAQVVPEIHYYDLQLEDGSFQKKEAVVWSKRDAVLSIKDGVVLGSGVSEANVSFTRTAKDGTTERGSFEGLTGYYAIYGQGKLHLIRAENFLTGEVRRGVPVQARPTIGSRIDVDIVNGGAAIKRMMVSDYDRRALREIAASPAAAVLLAHVDRTKDGWMETMTHKAAASITREYVERHRGYEQELYAPDKLAVHKAVLGAQLVNRRESAGFQIIPINITNDPLKPPGMGLSSSFRGEVKQTDGRYHLVEHFVDGNRRTGWIVALPKVMTDREIAKGEVHDFSFEEGSTHIKVDGGNPRFTPPAPESLPAALRNSNVVLNRDVDVNEQLDRAAVDAMASRYQNDRLDQSQVRFDQALAELNASTEVIREVNESDLEAEFF